MGRPFWPMLGANKRHSLPRSSYASCPALFGLAGEGRRPERNEWRWSYTRYKHDDDAFMIPSRLLQECRLACGGAHVTLDVLSEA